MEDCVFCKVVAGELPSMKVLETSTLVAFLDIRPLTQGHTLVVPKTHRETLLDLETTEAAELMWGVQEVAEKLLDTLHAEGYTLLMSNKPAGGQEVPHVHMHVVPRWEDDKVLRFKRASAQTSVEDTHQLLMGTH